MRLRFIGAFACAMIAAAAGRAQAAPTSIDVVAQHVAFYSDRYVLAADGDVRVRLSDGTTLRGDTFTMDLKLDRYLIAGNVRLENQTQNVHDVGAAFAGFVDFDRSYFLPATPEPDRWTFYGENFKETHAGLDQPGDAFHFSDVAG